MKNILDKILKEELKLDAWIVNIVKLHGDASYRTYYRAFLSDNSSLIVMQMPEGKSSVSEEISNFEGSSEELPFINVAAFLQNRGISVPAIHRYDDEDRLMILEDLGDESLARAVDSTADSTLLEWYKRAVELLCQIQSETKTDPSGKCIAFKRSFDQTLLNWEFDHFLEFGIEARGEKISGNDLAIFKEQTRDISQRIESLPYGFTLRDFQSRNILIKNDNLYIIDFQDALQGPKVYDLVSLTRDSYSKLDDDMLNELIERYANLTGRPYDELRLEFDLVTIQRKLKDAGRFVYIDRVKKNANYLRFIPKSLDYAREALERLPEYGALYEALRKYVPEWKEQ